MGLLNSRAFLHKIVADVRASYWFWPGTIVAAAMILAECTVWLDANPDVLPFDLPDRITAIDPGGARDTLSTIATAVIGVAGVMFSMTLVAVSFAANNFGPRLIGNFMRDRGTQISFGLMLGTFVFNVAMLRAVQDTGDAAVFVPYMGLVMALVLTLISVFTIIYYIHHVPETINVSNITSDLGQRLGQSVRELIEERASWNVEMASPAAGTRPIPVNLDACGYIQQMDGSALIEIARSHDWVIEVCNIPGDFITPHLAVMKVHAATDLTDRQLQSLRDAFATGTSRTEAQATTYIADQLVEMIARALSPGFNDPFTAMNCLNWLHAGLLDALLYRGGLHDFETQRVRIAHLDFAGLFAAGFTAAAAYTTTDRMCRQRHLTLTQDLMHHATGENRRVIASLLHSLKSPEHEIRL